MPRRVHALAALLALGCAAARRHGGASTPEELVEHAVARVAAGSYGALLALYPPGERARVVAVHVGRARRAPVEDPEPGRGLAAILERHGAPADLDRAPDPAAALAGVDAAALFGDLLRLLERRQADRLPRGALRAVRVEGDVAVARIGETRRRLVRVDGRWYLAPE